MKQAIRQWGVAFTALLCMAPTAHAGQNGCTAAATAGCDSAPAADTSFPTLRESLDKTRSDLAARFGGLQLVAFGDVHSSYGDRGEQKLNWGALELDASADLNHDLQAALAIVNSQGAGTSLAAGFLDYHTFGGRIAPRGRLWAEKGFHVQLGRFDVPFGNDWQFFASKDSVSISRPLTTELVMGGGYNDEGMRMLGNNGTVNFNAFLLHGFGAGRLLGGRIGVMPFNVPFSPKEAREPKIAEFGLSYLYDAGSAWQKSETAFAADAEVRMGTWSGRYEHMTRQKAATADSTPASASGWHVTLEHELGDTLAWQTRLFARYERGTVQPATATGPGDDRDVRVAIGSSSNVGNSDLLQLKFEVQHYRAATAATREQPGFGRRLLWFTQLVVVL